VRDIKVISSSATPIRKPYKWKAAGAEILSKINQARGALKKAEADELFDGN